MWLLEYISTFTYCTFITIDQMLSCCYGLVVLYHWLRYVFLQQEAANQSHIMTLLLKTANQA